MFHNSQNSEYMSVILDRLKKDKPLVWTSQFCGLINSAMETQNISSVNDIGCQVGQFYKSLQYHGIGAIKYNGYDLEDLYLEGFKKFFPEVSDNLSLLDIAKQIPNYADVSVMSATLEHITKYKEALSNILRSTEKLVLIRTFLGEKYKKSLVWKEGADTPYKIQQFDWDTIISIFIDSGFKVKILQDSYTKSIPQMINIDYRSKSPIIRTQYVIMAER